MASMADEPKENGAIPARRMTVEEYQRLEEIGVLGEQVELIEGQILFGRYPFMFSGEAVRRRSRGRHRTRRRNPHDTEPLQTTAEEKLQDLLDERHKQKLHLAYTTKAERYAARRRE